jgi:hypothetical protein
MGSLISSLASGLTAVQNMLNGNRRLTSTLVGRIYRRIMTSQMHKYLRRYVNSVPHCGLAETLLSDRQGINEFDDQLCQHLGFLDAEDYYSTMSASNYISGLRVPLLSLHARNDPIAASSSQPVDDARRNPFLVLAETKHGGHVSYYAHCRRDRSSWATRPILEFLRLGAVLVPPLLLSTSSIDNEKRPALVRRGSMLTDPVRPEIGFELVEVSLH